VAVDLLTTNETYFFREPKHFALLRELALEARDKNRALRVWSAASSSGEEPYSIAMVLADVWARTAAWEVLGTDISTRVLQRARAATIRWSAQRRCRRLT
jgi:chemotaxis protein methyltransferase CheR